jgi:diguanylate cyclase (GGDEF)-like protein/PAS domain S-box-containing protein
MLKQLGVAALYALLFYVGDLYFENIDNREITGYFEPTTGLALAAMLIGGKRYAWGVFFGAILIRAISANSFWAMIVPALGDTLQNVLGAWLLTRKGRFDLRLQSIHDYFRLILLGGCVSIVIGALLVNTVLLWSGFIPPENYLNGLIQWWMSDTLGVILVTPLIMVWWRAKDIWCEAAHKMEPVVLIGLVILVGQIVFLDLLHDSLGQVAKDYWIFLPTTWVAVRLGARGTVIALIVVAVQALSGAIQGTGFFADDIAKTHLINYWFYILTLSLVSMTLAVYFAERKQSDAKLRLAASVFTHAREGIMITDRDGTILDVNETFSRITGYSRNEALGRNPAFLGSGRHEHNYYAAMWRDLTENGHWYGEIWNRHKNGGVYAAMQNISAVRDVRGNIQQYVALFADITMLKAHESELERIAHYDALTGLPNRVLLADRLFHGVAQAQRREQRLAVVYLDLDGFKVVNDSHGHQIGDQLLITLAIRMKQVLREGDTLARLGGDEFVAVLVDLADIESSVPMLTRLLDAAAQPVQVGDLVLQVSASLGVTFYPQAEELDSDKLLRQADLAMYQAKQAGKNRYHFFDVEQDRSVRNRHESLERIQRALNKREFVLYYQPKVNMRTGTVIGAEALIRWQHPEKGLLLPAVFLPVIEDHPLSIEVGEWVIASALTQMERWHAAGLNIPVSVNVCAHQLRQADFVDRLRALLAAHPGIMPSHLELEVRETGALEHVALVYRVIEACREIGVSLALDDFGTGYSSLTYLKRLPVTMLKIDQSFVRDMLNDPENLVILDGMIGLITAFGRQVIAEGVETVEHGELLLQLGCELAQGYSIAHPMPAHELPSWSAAWHTDPAWVDLPTFGRDDLPLLFANIEHRAWILNMEAYIKGERDAPPPLDRHQCRFGIWLDTKGQVRYGAQPAFEAIDLLHRQVHVLGAELLELLGQDRIPEALARLGELHDLRDALLKQLKTLVREIQRVTPISVA